MQKYITRKELIIYIAFAVAFSLLALLVNWQSFVENDILTQPLRWIGNGIRQIGYNTNAGAFAVYIFICLLPLLYPAIQTIRQRRFRWRYVSWLLLSVFLFVMLYFAINPHRIMRSPLDPFMPPANITDYYRDMTFLGLIITFLAMLAFCLILEFYCRQKEDGTKVFIYAKALFAALIVSALASVFFLGVLQAKLEITDVLESGTLYPNISVNLLNILSVLLLKFLPTFFCIVLFVLSKAFIDDMKNDMFAEGNIGKLNRIIKVCAMTVFVTLGSTIAVNILNFIFSGKLLNPSYSVSIPFAMIITACLMMIFAKILIKSININEENKLVI